MNIGKSIKVALAKREKNQTWLSEQLGISRAYVSLLATNNKGASTRMIQRISGTLGFTVSEFIALGED